MATRSALVLTSSHPICHSEKHTLWALHDVFWPTTTPIHGLHDCTNPTSSVNNCYLCWVCSLGTILAIHILDPCLWTLKFMEKEEGEKMHFPYWPLPHSHNPLPPPKKNKQKNLHKLLFSISLGNVHVPSREIENNSLCKIWGETKFIMGMYRRSSQFEENQWTFSQKAISSIMNQFVFGSFCSLFCRVEWSECYSVSGIDPWKTN